MKVSVVAAVNDPSVLTANLLSSPGVRSGEWPVVQERNRRCAALAYNTGLDRVPESDLVVFAHQDVYLPRDWSVQLADAVAWLEDGDPDWGVLSCFGRDARGAIAGRVWSSGLARTLGSSIDRPTVVSAVDELLLVIRRRSGLRFDENLPGFHLYAADLVAAAADRGMKTYVADMPVVHNSQPVRRLDGGYAAAYRYMQRKWRHRLPLETLVVPVTRCGVPLHRARCRLAAKRLLAKGSFGGREPDPRVIAERCGFLPATLL